MAALGYGHMDLRAKADEYQCRANRLREIAKGFHGAGAHHALLQAADTWELLARAALRDLEWQRQAAISARIVTETSCGSDRQTPDERSVSDIHEAAQATDRDCTLFIEHQHSDTRRRA